MAKPEAGVIVLKDNAHELHWRKEPPKWKGNIDMAYKKFYPHLVDEIYCRHCGAVPCPLDHETEKGTRLKDLEFVCDLVQAKKDMEAHVAKVEQQMKNLEYKHARWQDEKHTLMDEVRTFQFMQKEWEIKRNVMQGEIGKLSAIRDEHYKLVAVHKQDQVRLQNFAKEVYSLTTERDDVQAEAANLKKLVSSQVDKVNQLNRDVKEVSTELTETKSSVKILKVQLEEVNDLKTTVQTQLDEKDTLIKDLEAQIRQIIEDLLDKTRVHEEKELTSENLIERLRQQVKHLKDSVEDVVGERADLQSEVNRLKKEIELLRKQLAEGRRFKQFVEIKREVNQLRERNICLTKNLPAETLPVMKKSGRVKSAGIRTSNRRAVVSLTRPKSSPHERHKSAEPVQEYEQTVVSTILVEDL